METKPTVAIDISHITSNQIASAARQFIGTINQIPPLHSAIKVDGRRAYELAREGKDIELKAREIVISEFEIISIEKSQINFRVVCSKGTYIRSLARDFGNALGVGAYLAELCRTRIGTFKLTDALPVEEVIGQAKTVKES
jgi:tRNA pseudouridine55 synthase